VDEDQAMKRCSAAAVHVTYRGKPAVGLYLDYYENEEDEAPRRLGLALSEDDARIMGSALLEHADEIAALSHQPLND
jgi:hypothetical protein